MEQEEMDERLAKQFPILRYFEYDHLPERLQATSKVYHDLAWREAVDGQHGPEVAAGLRKLLEAKDCFVRARLPNKGAP
jgi:hypothetical protein